MMQRRPKPRSVMRMLARGYFPHELSWLINNPIRRLFIAPETLADRLDISETNQVLEIGPGSGYFSPELARRVPLGRLELFDVQVEMLAKARRKLAAQGFPNVGFTQGNASVDLPFRDDQFDRAVLVTVLGEVPERDACVESLHRVLRLNGVVAIHEHLPDPDFINFAQLKPTLERHGFQLQRQHGKWWNYTATFQKR